MVGLIQLMAIVTVNSLVSFAPIATGSSYITSGGFLISFFIATLIFVLIMKVYRGDMLYRILFYAVIALGLSTVFNTVFPTDVMIGVTALFIAALIIAPCVWVYDLAVGLAAVGIGPLFGLQMTWDVAAIILIVLSLYDIISVYYTKHMVTMAYRMLKSRAIFGLIIPEHLSGYDERMDAVRPGAGFLVLGGGDVVLPMLLTCSVYFANPTSAYTAVIGVLVGVTANHVVLTRFQRPIPALPLIATFTILGAIAGFYV